MTADPPQRNEETMAEALRPFGWEGGPEFWRRYYADPWVFNLANAVEVLTERAAALEDALDDIAEMGHYQRQASRRCDVCGQNWPCGHAVARALLPEPVGPATVVERGSQHDG